jgi:hypothetical protein
VPRRVSRRPFCCRKLSRRSCSFGLRDAEPQSYGPRRRSCRLASAINLHVFSIVAFIGRPEYSRMVLGFSIYLEKPSAFTVGMAIAHAILSTQFAQCDLGAESPCSLSCTEACQELGSHPRCSLRVCCCCPVYDHLVDHNRLTALSQTGRFSILDL